MISNASADLEPWCSRLTRRPVTPEIAGSSPVGSATGTNRSRLVPLLSYIRLALRRAAARLRGQVAQLVEHRTENPGVAGSIPALSTNAKALRKRLSEGPSLCACRVCQR